MSLLLFHTFTYSRSFCANIFSVIKTSFKVFYYGKNSGQTLETVLSGLSRYISSLSLEYDTQNLVLSASIIYLQCE